MYKICHIHQIICPPVGTQVCLIFDIAIDPCYFTHLIYFTIQVNLRLETREGAPPPPPPPPPPPHPSACSTRNVILRSDSPIAQKGGYSKKERPKILQYQIKGFSFFPSFFVWTNQYVNYLLLPNPPWYKSPEHGASASNPPVLIPPGIDIGKLNIWYGRGFVLKRVIRAV